MGEWRRVRTLLIKLGKVTKEGERRSMYFKAYKIAYNSAVSMLTIAGKLLQKVELGNSTAKHG